MLQSVYLAVCLTTVIGSVLATGPGQSIPPASHLAEAEVFESARRSVFLIETESGQGSGFLIDASGLILTNDHVVGTGDYLAVGVAPNRKYVAAVVARDRSRDLAIIRVHPEAVSGVQPLRFGVPSGRLVRVGERVMAIGSTFTGEGAVLTLGSVSQVDADRILADLNVNSGTSGGPLLNASGDVVGICTFYVRAPAGPGFAGIVPDVAVRPIVAQAMASPTRTLPSPERLPIPSLVPYPVAALRDRAWAIRDIGQYGTTVGGVRIDVLTPPAVYFEANNMRVMQARKNGRGVPGGEYAWHALTGHIEPIVAIRVSPDDVSPRPHRDTTRRSVLRLRLVRNGTDVVPIVPGRFCSEEARNSSSREQDGCMGLYQYCPEPFAADADIRLHVYLEGAAPIEWRLPTSLIRAIWSDFGPWRAAVGATAPCG